MTQDNQEHLTIEQLSAYIDQELSSDEQAAVAAHLQTCEQCQRALAGLRQAVLLVRALPQVEVPRSFVLPEELAPAPILHRPRETEPVVPLQTRRSYLLRRSVRALSTLAAAIGLIFILSGVLAGIPLGFHGGGAASSSNMSTDAGQSPTLGRTPDIMTTRKGEKTPPAVTNAPTPTPGPTNTGTHTPSSAQSPPPAVLDLAQPAGRLSLGSLLLLLSIVGLVVTRRRHT
ncbi:MAG TPA: zf-HC2 domain-containing protein [Ktedonobacteraceae bacterium]|nr:zf-HC2 domain-containing protein [Ktedonobacteraceae bacterium]